MGSTPRDRSDDGRPVMWEPNGRTIQAWSVVSLALLVLGEFVVAGVYAATRDGSTTIPLGG